VPRTLRAGEGQTAPRQFLGQLSSPLRRFVRTESGSASVLLAVTAVALVWANSPWSSSYEELWHTELVVGIGDSLVAMDLEHWINDGLMALFFFVIGLEVRRDLSVGELTDRRRLVLPVVAGIGGLLVPALLYLAVNPSGEAVRGWGVVIGSDTAFMLGALALVGPPAATQLRVFLLTLMVFDDLVAVSIIGIAYSDDLHPEALLLAACGVVGLVLMGRLGVWRTWPYALVTLVVWGATLESGVHASIAGMTAGLCIPSFLPRRPEVDVAARVFRAFRQSPMPEVGRSARVAVARAVPVNERMQVVLLPWASYVVVPVFALANAGVDLRGGLLGDALTSPVTWGVVLGLVVGKVVGIGVGALGGVRLGLGRLPQGVGPGQVLGGAALSGIGFTVSLLIVGLAFEDPVLAEQATVGVLLALLMATALGWLTFRLAAVLHGETTASLPMVLDREVDARRDHVLGRPDAPLTLVEYADFECPFCARATGVAAEVREHFGDDLRYVLRHLPLPEVHPHAEDAAAAAEAAALQGRFWEMHDLLFAHQDALDVDSLLGYAADLGLDVQDFLDDLRGPTCADRVREDAASAVASGARGTPTFFVGTRRHVGPYDAGTLIAELEACRDDAAPGPTAEVRED
jgi:Na+/H+ antiporter NhaA